VPDGSLSPPTDELLAGRYRIERRLARGGQASVYLAYQEPLNRPVALKVLVPPPESSDQELRAFEERFLLEAKTLAALDHPNIVVVHDYGEVGGGRFYIAMEYVDGKRFSEILRERPLDPLRSLKLLYQVCAALRYAHRRGVIHRDVKNSNVMVRVDDNGEERVKVVDFGIVKLMEHDPGITQVGAILGSPHFMAPEQAKGMEIDHRADIYSVGVLLFCGLVGRYPFNGPNSTAILTAHITQDVPTFDTIDPNLNLPRGLEGIVRKCLSKDPVDRYADVDALMDALKPYVDGTLPLQRHNEVSLPGDIGEEELPAPVTTDRAATVGVTTAASNRLMPVVVGLAVLVVLLIVAVFARGDGGRGAAPASLEPVTGDRSKRVEPSDEAADVEGLPANAAEGPTGSAEGEQTEAAAPIEAAAPTDAKAAKEPPRKAEVPSTKSTAKTQKSSPPAKSTAKAAPSEKASKAAPPEGSSTPTTTPPSTATSASPPPVEVAKPPKTDGFEQKSDIVDPWEK
jgi:serine/threonine-protein kinase